MLFFVKNLIPGPCPNLYFVDFVILSILSICHTVALKKKERHWTFKKKGDILPM